MLKNLVIVSLAVALVRDKTFWVKMMQSYKSGKAATVAAGQKRPKKDPEKLRIKGVDY